MSLLTKMGENWRPREELGASRLPLGARAALCAWHSFESVVPNLSGTRDWFHGRQSFHRRVGVGGGPSSGGNSSEASNVHPLLTSCCVAQFLTGHRLVPVHGPRVGDPCFGPPGTHWSCFSKTILLLASPRVKAHGSMMSRLRNTSLIIYRNGTGG